MMLGLPPHASVAVETRTWMWRSAYKSCLWSRNMLQESWATPRLHELSVGSRQPGVVHGEAVGKQVLHLPSS